ncbi:MAG: ATP synthase F1 subunit epsilon [Lachnospiraceae bacterium]|nr:ATP synthase F1 subunit epsilon [Lachnospiraceae bacterium]MDD3615091.1 ATP synthase F1 subunit epsilon [Lachnospiraceae bacterium]
MDGFSLKIIASNGVFFDGRAKDLIFHASDGRFEILPHHENMVIAVEIGDAKYLDLDGNWVEFLTSRGFAEVLNNRITMIVNSAERPEDIDMRRAEEAKERAEEKLLHQQSRQEYVQTQASLARAMSRLKFNQGKKFNI